MFGCVVMIIMTMTLIMLTADSEAHADDWWDNWKVMGISAKDFENRNVYKFVAGGVGSIIAHELLGHFLASEMTGMGSAHFHCGVAVAGDGYYDASNDQRAWFSASGLFVQSLGSIIFTSIPSTRHSDYTLGWNVGTTLTTAQYAIIGGGDKETSDTYLMEANGWPGTEIAWGATAIGGIATYYSLDKYKDAQDTYVKDLVNQMKRKSNEQD